MIYAIMLTGKKIYFDHIDALFDFVNSNLDVAGGWIGG